MFTEGSSLPLVVILLMRTREIAVCEDQIFQRRTRLYQEKTPTKMHGSFTNYPQGMMRGNSRFPMPSNGVQGSRYNSRMQGRVVQYQELGTEMAALTIEENSRSRAHRVIASRMQNSGYPNQQYMQNMGPLPPRPNNWIHRSAAGESALYGRQENASGGELIRSGR